MSLKQQSHCTTDQKREHLKRLTFPGNYHWQAVITHLEGSHEDTMANCSLPVIYKPEVMTSGQDISVAAPFKEPVVQHQTRFSITSSSNHLLPAFSLDPFRPKYLPSSTQLSLWYQISPRRVATTFPDWGKSTALRTACRGRQEYIGYLPIPPLFWTRALVLPLFLLLNWLFPFLVSTDTTNSFNICYEAAVRR